MFYFFWIKWKVHVADLNDTVPRQMQQAQFTQDAEQLAKDARKLSNTLWSMGVFTQFASNIIVSRQVNCCSIHNTDWRAQFETAPLA